MQAMHLVGFASNIEYEHTALYAAHLVFPSLTRTHLEWSYDLFLRRDYRF